MTVEPTPEPRLITEDFIESQAMEAGTIAHDRVRSLLIQHHGKDPMRLYRSITIRVDVAVSVEWADRQ